jgi:hypothetical protein
MAYAVDTWIGDAQSDYYGDDVYKNVVGYNDTNYRSFSYLLRSLFDDALTQFADCSIDILHIDGLHTFDAVSHDFYSWLPKVKSGGLILLHDIAARHADFGVWRLWDELKTKGATFEFRHSWGLGIFEKPNPDQPRPAFLEALLAGDLAMQEHVRRFYSLAASELEWNHSTDGFLLRTQKRDHGLQVFQPLPEGYSEEKSQTVLIRANEWQHVTVELPSGLADGSLRIDISDCPALIDIRGIAVRSTFDGRILWTAGGAGLDVITVGGTLARFEPELSNGACRFFSYGFDPQLYLPRLDPQEFDQPVSLEIWIRLQADLGDMISVLQKKNDEIAKTLTEKEQALQRSEDLTAQMDGVRAEKERAQQQFADLMTQMDTLRAERDQVLREVDRKETQLYLLGDCATEARRLEEENAGLKEKHVQLEKKYGELCKEQNQLAEERNRLSEEYKKISEAQQNLQFSFANVVNSRSWRLTEFLRRTARLFRGRR